MGALSFNYSVFPKPKVSTKFFEYKWNTPLSEYRFKYERYAALSDASIFNAPVAVTKVATGVRLYDLFVERPDRDTAYFYDMAPVSSTHVIDCSQIDKNIFLYKVVGPIPWTSEILDKAYNGNFNYTPDSFERTLGHHNYTVQENIGYFILPPHWKANTVEFTMEGVPYERKSINRLYQETVNRPFPFIKVSPIDVYRVHRLHDSDMKIYDLEFAHRIREPIDLHLHFTYRVERTKDDNFRILPNETIVRVGDSNLDIITDAKDIFAWMYDYRVINLCEPYQINRPNDYSMVIYEDELAKRDIYEIDTIRNESASKYTSQISNIGTESANKDTSQISNIRSESAYKDNSKMFSPENFISSAFPKRDMNIGALNQLLLKTPSEISTDFSFTNTARPDRKIHLRNGHTMSTRPSPSANIFDSINAIREKMILSIFENPIVDKVFFKISIFEQIYGGEKGTDGYFGLIFDPNNYLSAPSDKKLYYQAYLSGEKQTGHIMFDKILGGSKLINESNTSCFHDELATKPDRFILENKGYHLMPEDGIVCELSLADFSIREHRYAIAIDGVFAAPIGKNLDEFHAVWMYTHNKTTDCNGLGNVHLIQKPKDITENHNEFLEGADNHINFYPNMINFDGGSKDNIMVQIPPSTISVMKQDKEVLIYVHILARTRHKDVSVHSYEIIFGMKDDGIKIYDHLIPVDKDRLSMVIWPNLNPTIRTKYDFSIYDNDTTEKSRHPLNLDDSSSLIHKIKYGMVIHNCDDFTYKKRKGINLDLAVIWSTYKIRHSMVIPDCGGNVYKIPKDLVLDVTGEGAYKKRRPMSINPDDGIIHKKSYPVSINPDIEGAIRTAYKAAVSNYVKYPNWESLGGFIVPISKVRHQAMIDYVNEFVWKRYRDVMITQGSFGSVLARPGMLEFNVSIDKLPRPVFIDYLNEMLIKTRFKATIEEGTFGFKKPYMGMVQYDEPWGYLNPKPVQVEQGIFGYKDAVKGFLYADEWTSKGPKPLMITEGEFLYKSPLRAEVFDDEWLDKSPLLCYYSYDIWGAKDRKKAFLTPQEMAAQNIKEIQVDGYLMGSKDQKKVMLQFGDFAAKGISDVWYEYGVFANRLIKSSSIAKDMDWAFKDAHKCDLHPNDFGNWAWVYETPDPFQYDKYGIDELLLPEKDTQYEKFEELIFDREHMRPRNAIKEISDTQWIAKLPIRHPVEKWEEVGKVYEDSAIKWENYFGIQSSVIHDMFLKYYRIWEKNMFKFSTMTMQQAGNLMLEYLWSWIPDYYPLDQIEQAYRAFRLIRWYTECAVINNSQYIISYEYANLTWPDSEHMGICHIPNDLQEYDPTNVMENNNDTMYSDTAPGHLCLRNNPIYTRSNDVWVTFKIKNKRNTTITLSLYNQSGSVNIYLNNRLIDVVSAHGSQKLAYNIRYTGAVNEFKIEKKAADNLDDNFLIGHISIANQAFKDLTIEFDPALRAGNKPLNEVAEKLLAFAALHDRKDVAYYEMTTKNLAVSEVYKMLAKYWQLHHENKWKGKRLTIKQV